MVINFWAGTQNHGSMRNKVVQFEEIDAYRAWLGGKTLNLKKCADWGFRVPRFVAIPSSASHELFSDGAARGEATREAAHILACERYAVRSSALAEDCDRASLAGQLLTKTNVREKDLDNALFEVLQHAKAFFKDDLRRFSLIIQEYIPPDVSGVTFTRNPSGDRAMVIEYGYCEGEKIVGGAVTPRTVSLYWNDPARVHAPQFFSSYQLVEHFKEIEQKNGFPQDIEWCIHHGTFYVLQMRPITTISASQYAQMLLLEKILPQHGHYYFEKTEVSEITPRPTPITFDILRAIYSMNGPVDRVYRNYCVHYADTVFLRVIGNELYVDREKEIKGLLPSYSYFVTSKLAPTLGTYVGAFTTIKNLFFLNTIKTNRYESLFKSVKEKLEERQVEMSFNDALKKFFTEYEIIFEINLLSGLSMKKLHALLRKEHVSFPDIFDSRSLFVDLKRYFLLCPRDLRGNTLELFDESVFATPQHREETPKASVVHWWEHTPLYKKKLLHGPVMQAIVYERLRELGRWLTVKNTNTLRDLLTAYARGQGFKDEKNIFLHLSIVC